MTSTFKCVYDNKNNGIRKGGLTAIHYAIIYRKMAALRVLIEPEQCCNTRCSITIDKTEIAENSGILHLAIACGDPDVLSFIIFFCADSTFDFGFENKAGQTPLDLLMMKCT